jgi:hypothetical protein
LNITPTCFGWFSEAAGTPSVSHYNFFIAFDLILFSDQMYPRVYDPAIPTAGGHIFDLLLSVVLFMNVSKVNLLSLSGIHLLLYNLLPP